MLPLTLGPKANWPLNSMPGYKLRITPDVRKGVVFVGYGDDKHFTPQGTAFLIMYKDVRYLVSAKHVVIGFADDPYAIKVNTIKGGSNVILVDNDVHWFFHPDDTVDVAVAQFNYDLKAAGFDALYIPVTEGSKNNDIGLGDETYTVGLFRFLAGKQRNLPIVHTGTIAMLPGDEKIPVRDWDDPEPNTTKRKLVEGYLVESVGLNGLSGSPVLYRVPIDIELPTDQGKMMWGTMLMRDVSLAGIWHAAWDARPDEVLAVNMGRNVTVPVGMGVVVPVAKLVEVLEMPKVEAGRKEILEQREAGMAATPTSLIALPSIDENPTHREDFNRLLSAASQKPKQDD